MSDEPEKPVIFEPLGKFCWMPLGHPDSELLKSLHRAFCSHRDRKNADHKCTGVVTLSEDNLLLRCPQCGDAKFKLET